MVLLRQYKSGRMQNFTYLIGEEASGEAAVIDPHEEVERIASEVQALGLRAKWITNTHGHWDHTVGNKPLAKIIGAKVLQHEAGPGPADRRLRDGESLRLGNLEVKVLHTPGHSPDSICLLAPGALFTGDTLFIGECGRVDLPGGSPEQLYESLLLKLRSLPDDLEVYPGHDYGPVPHDSLGNQKAKNYTLKPRSREEFLQFMREP